MKVAMKDSEAKQSRLAVFSSGIWRLRDQIVLMSHHTPHRWWWSARRVDAVAGWGHKPTAHRARAYAARHRLPYIAFEDGFVRSIRPGNVERPASLVMDTSGIYYDARQPSSLEAMVQKRVSNNISEDRARSAIATLRSHRISKYNNGPAKDLEDIGLNDAFCKSAILVIDQTRNDESIVGALADDQTFERMLLAALGDDGGQHVVIKSHPDTADGRKSGYFTESSLFELAERNADIKRSLEDRRIRIVRDLVNPWVLLEACPIVYTVSSQMGFEGLLAGCEVHCFGAAFYASWGLTVDHGPVIPRRGHATLEALFSAAYFDYARYFCEERRELVELENVLDEFSS